MFFAACGGGGAKSGGTTTPPPAPGPAAPQELPGTYQAGLGNPYIQVQNNLDVDLSIQVNDASGYAYTAYVYPGQTYDLTINPGTFSYYASAGSYTDSGSYTVALDNAYTWTWTLDPNYAGGGGGSTTSTGSGYSWSETGKSTFMQGCTGNGGSYDLCNCSMLELQARYSEDYMNSNDLTEAQINEVVNICFDAGYQ